MTTPAPVGVPSSFESLELKATAIETSVLSHLASMKATTLADIKAIATDGAAIPAKLQAISSELAAIMPEIQSYGQDFFTLLQLVVNVTALKAVPVIPPTPAS